MKIGFVGGGNMASALMGGLISSGKTPGDIILFDTDSEKCSKWQENGVCIADNAAGVEEISDIIVLAVKPNIIGNVLREFKGYKEKIYVSIAAGISLSYIEDILGAGMKIVRTMPNTPAQVRCGMTVITPNKNLSDKETEDVISVLFAVGDTEIMPEKFMSIATALHGSSPAYVYMMIDAMADAGVKMGLTKAQALRLAAKAVEGSAKMVLESDLHPEQLKDNVCSPGGTTIAAVCDLEENGFRAVVQSAVLACYDKAEQMNK